jgi:hypothetical protein
VRRTSAWLTCLLDRLSLGRQVPPPPWSCTPAHHLRLLGVTSALALPLQTRLALQPTFRAAFSYLRYFCGNRSRSSVPAISIIYRVMRSHILAIFAKIIIATYCFQNGYTT